MANRIRPIYLPFVLTLGPGKKVNRFVHAYLVEGSQPWLIDTGAAGYQQGIVEALAESGRSPSDIAGVINTHEHPDHIGGNSWALEQAHPQFLCHARAVPWIEDLDLQARERPILGFSDLAGKPIKVTRTLEESDVVSLGQGTSFQVIHTPGHSPGSMSLFFPEEGVLLSADAIQPVGGLPLYQDVTAARESMRRLLALRGVKTLYASHSTKPFTGDDTAAYIQSGLDYVDRVELAVRQALAVLPLNTSPEELTRAALARLGLDPPPVTPITIQSIESHRALMKEEREFGR